jgi:hypothetical protein
VKQNSDFLVEKNSDFLVEKNRDLLFCLSLKVIVVVKDLQGWQLLQAWLKGF